MEAAGQIDNVTVTFAGQSKVLFVYPWQGSGVSTVTHWLVGCVNQAGTFTLFRTDLVANTNGDRLPDSTTTVALLDSGAVPMYASQLVRIGSTGTVFMLDRRCQDIIKASDTNADGFPDSIGVAPFAEASEFPVLLNAQILVAESDSALSVVLGSSRLGFYSRFGTLYNHRGSYQRFTDADSDGVADANVQWTKPDPAPSLWVNLLEVGQTAIKIQGTVGEGVQIWKMDAQLAPSQLLASQQLSAGWNTLTVAALTEGTWVRINYTARPESGLLKRALPASVQLHSVEPYYLNVDGDSATVLGVNFPAFVGARVRYGEFDLNTATFPSSQVMTVTRVSSEEISISIPSLPASAAGRARIEVYEASTPSQTLLSFSVGLCE